MEFLCKSIFGDFQIFFISAGGKHAVSLKKFGTIRCYIGYLENAIYPPDKNISKTFNQLEFAYLSVKMVSLIQKHKSIRKGA